MKQAILAHPAAPTPPRPATRRENILGVLYYSPAPSGPSPGWPEDSRTKTGIWHPTRLTNFFSHA